jgi:hypothetical protein
MAEGINNVSAVNAEVESHEDSLEEAQERAPKIRRIEVVRPEPEPWHLALVDDVVRCLTIPDQGCVDVEIEIDTGEEWDVTVSVAPSCDQGQENPVPMLMLDVSGLIRHFEAKYPPTVLAEIETGECFNPVLEIIGWYRGNLVQVVIILACLGSPVPCDDQEAV